MLVRGGAFVKRPTSTYPHTLTSDQFAIISLALDNARQREAAYVERREGGHDDHLEALDELRALLAFAGPIVINARSAVSK